MIMYSSTIALTKNMKHPGVQIFKDGSNNELAVEEDIQFVGSCDYNARASIGLLAEANVNLLILRGNTRNTAEKSVTASASSNFFEIVKGDSIRSLARSCRIIFERKIMDDVDRDLRKMISETFVAINAGNSSIKTGAMAALYGPETEVKIGDETYNVKPATVSGTSQLNIQGELVRKDKSFLDVFGMFTDNESQLYRMVVGGDGKLQSIQFLDASGKETEPFKGVKDLTQAIATSAYVEYIGPIGKQEEQGY